MSNEVVLTGAKAINLLKHPKFPQENIFGAEFFDGNEEGETDLVNSFTDQYILTHKGRYSINQLKSDDREIIFKKTNAEFFSLLEASIPKSVKIEADLNQRLIEIGCPLTSKNLSLDNAKLLCNFLTGDRLPSPQQRSKIYKLAMTSEKHLSWWLKYFSKWLSEVEEGKSPEARGRMHLAVLSRYSGNFKQAIEVSNVVEFQRHFFPCSDEILSALCTTRAATFVDIFELHYDPELLKAARLTANKAYALTQSNKTSEVYRRISKFENELSAINYKRQLNAAYKEWRSWTHSQ